jgi:hypothetical protein
MSKRLVVLLMALGALCSSSEIFADTVSVAADVEIEASAELLPEQNLTEDEQEAEGDVELSSTGDVVLPSVHEIEGVRIESGPVEVVPGPGCCEENIQALAHTTVLALHQTLQELSGSVGASAQAEIAEAQESLEVAGEEVCEAVVASGSAVTEIGQAVSAVGNMLAQTTEAVIAAVSDAPSNIEAFLNFLIDQYGVLVEYLSNGWKLMLYSSVEGATRQFVELAVTRSGVVVDLSAYNALDKTAQECLHRMDVAQAQLLEAAGARSGALRNAVECYLTQYRDWFTGKSEALVDSAATEQMLRSLNVRSIDASLFSLKNLEKFSELGGVARHQNLYFSIRPLDLVDEEPARSVSGEEVSAESRSVANAQEDLSSMTKEWAENAVDHDIADAVIRSCEEEIQ